MPKTRLLKAPKPKKQNPKSPVEWNALLRKAISRAEAIEDSRLAGLKLALSKGQAERKLRRMCIVSDADLDREFKKSS